MTWTLIWFVVNLFFVVSVVAYMFMHRSYTEAKRQSNDAAIIRKLNMRRMLVGILSIVLFVAMSASFMINMRLNG
ncbi:CBS domain containing-hemolysin-like protein [Paenibacillus endophyticus]|uniref:CBS domain containing-hemolysin-like protein n=1 Tax=Paenibacillus endophyticus TaxID=1294268 RepID=A0A7W5CEP0_9BACL|nr:hypothetical protein [Paenibacillus endophyticus]MBB3156286.1 CBS domain containing-hemolysin-like protein [Paenibacillus endophyticus]